MIRDKIPFKKKRQRKHGGSSFIFSLLGAQEECLGGFGVKSGTVGTISYEIKLKIMCSPTYNPYLLFTF